MADVALEVLCLLVLDEDLLIIKLSVAVPVLLVKEFALYSSNQTSNQACDTILHTNSLRKVNHI